LGSARGTHARQALRSVAPLARLRGHASLDGRRTTMIETTTMDNPVGTVHAGVRDGRLCVLELGDDARFRRRLKRCGESSEPAHSSPSRRIVDALRRYFPGDVHPVADIEVDPLGGTDFQRRVWQALRSIPAGTTISYATLARR